MYTNYTKVVIKTRKNTARVSLLLLTSKPLEFIMINFKKTHQPGSKSLKRPIKTTSHFLTKQFPKAPSTSQQLLHFSMPSGAGEHGNSGPTKDTSPMMLIFNTLRQGREGEVVTVLLTFFPGKVGMISRGYRIIICWKQLDLAKSVMLIIYIYKQVEFSGIFTSLCMDVSLLGASWFLCLCSFPCDLILSANLEHYNCDFQKAMEFEV